MKFRLGYEASRIENLPLTLFSTVGGGLGKSSGGIQSADNSGPGQRRLPNQHAGCECPETAGRPYRSANADGIISQYFKHGRLHVQTAS